ncbi:MAG: hypothetical protein WDZ49_03435 [Litorilinea sp.]
MTRTIRIFVCTVLTMLVLVACDAPVDVPGGEPVATEPTPAVVEAPEAVPAPESPLSAQSPLAPPQVQPLAQDYVRPDGPHLLFSSARDEARAGVRGWYLLNLDSEEVLPAPVTNLDGLTVNSLSWVDELSLFIAQMTDAQNHSNLYLLDFAGAIVGQLTYDAFEAGNADYSAETELFVYVCLIQDLDICVTAANDPGLLNLTALNTREAGPQWSPDGETVLFVSNAAGVVNVWAVDADGANRRNLSAVGLDGALREEGDASWSPDGESILFRATADGNAEIYLMDADGENRRNLTENPANDANPVWSPDGSYIAFRSDRDEGQDIYVLDPATGDVVNVTNTPQTRENNFVWSVDSTQIVFDAQVDDVFDIYVVNVDGSDVRNLTNSPADDLDPQWVE